MLTLGQLPHSKLEKSGFARGTPEIIAKIAFRFSLRFSGFPMAEEPLSKRSRSELASRLAELEREASEVRRELEGRTPQLPRDAVRLIT